MTDAHAASNRGRFGRMGFVLAAAGSAIGLGNIWKFPYITGENGGGLFVLIYLVCIIGVGLPIMLAEILVGRTAQTSPVGAFRKMSTAGSPWILTGWLGVLTAFVILSYYSVVAGWSLHYVWLSVSGNIGGRAAGEIEGIFGALYGDVWANLGWHLLFMAVTIAIVIGGVKGGVERAARILMPIMFVLLLVLLGYAMTLDGFGAALHFVFAPHQEKLSGASVLEALGHSFFTLSLGMGAMLTYGSYLGPRENLVGTAIAVTVLDTAVALVACLVLFPITFTFGMQPAAGPGLVFKNIPMAFAQLPAGGLWSAIFFVLLTFAALTSAISLLEVASAYFIDERGMARRKAVLWSGGAIVLIGIPSALSGGTTLFGEGFAAAVGKNWFDTFDYVATNWMLPIGGLGIALFVSWRVGDQARKDALAEGSALGKARAFYLGWLSLLRYVVPVAIVAIVLHALKVF